MELKTKILVLGGTGAMGGYLVKLLSDSTHRIYVTTRSQRNSLGNIHYIQGNAHDLTFLQSLLQKGWDCVVDFMVYSTDEFKNRIELLLSATKQYVYLSSARVYADSVDPIVEISPRLLEVSTDTFYLKTDEYAITKAHQEDLLKKSKHKNWTIIRPYITYSENRLQLGVLEKEEWLYRALKGRSIVFSKEMAYKTTTLTHGWDVARGLTSIIGKEDALGQTFQITRNESLAWKDVLSVYLSVLKKHLGYKPKVLLCDLEQFTKMYPAKNYQMKYDRLFNRRFNNDKIGTFINVNSFVNPYEGLAECLSAFLKEIQFKHVNWKTEAINDKHSKEFTSLTEIKGVKQKIKYCFYRFT